MKRRGFTLVELLVVIGIITILIAILMPALSGARKTSQQIACANNLRQIVLATIQYGQDNKNKLPERYQPTVDLGTVGPMSWAYYNAYATLPAADSANIGRLVARGYLSGNWTGSGLQPDVPWLWCPAASADAHAGPGINNTLLTSSYLFNPHDVYSTIETSRYTRIDKYPRNRVLVVDMLWYPDSFFHMPAPGTAGWNMAFSDGHVVFIQSPTLYQYIVANYSTTGYLKAWEVASAADFLETMAEGENPLTTAITTTGTFNSANFYGIRLYSTAGKSRIMYNANEQPDSLP